MNGFFLILRQMVKENRNRLIYIVFSFHWVVALKHPNPLMDHTSVIIGTITVLIYKKIIICLCNLIVLIYCPIGLFISSYKNL